MENRIKIGDFIKLTGSTLKTIIYYHKIGLLPEPERSPGGYRLYGPAELNRMRLIKRLKSLGLDLQRIKEIIGDLNNTKTMREILLSLRIELLNEKKTLEQRVEKIDALLGEDMELLNQDIFVSPSFQMITEIMGTDQIEKYARSCPEIYDQHRKLYSILDDFQWGEDFREVFRILAEYFKDHPDHYQMALDFGARWAELTNVPEDDPRIDALARESALLLDKMPQVKGLMLSRSGQKDPLNGLYKEMVAGVLSPAQLKYQQLVEEYRKSNQED